MHLALKMKIAIDGVTNIWHKSGTQAGGFLYRPAVTQILQTKTLAMIHPDSLAELKMVNKI